MSQTKTPPWERTVFEYCENTSMLERAVRIAHDKGNPKLAEFAWSELQALQAVAEAAEHAMRIDLNLNTFCLCDECDEGETCVQCRLRDGLAEWRKICPR